MVALSLVAGAKLQQEKKLFDLFVSRFEVFFADLLKVLAAKGLDMAAMLQSRTSKLLAGCLQQPAASNLLQKNAIACQGSGSSGTNNLLLHCSKHFSTGAALCINKHPDVIRGKVPKSSYR